MSRHVLAGVPPAPSPSQSGLKILEIGDPGVYVKFFGRALNFAMFTEVQRPQHADRNNCAATQGAWLRISRQSWGDLTDPDWANSSLLDSIVWVYSPVSLRIAHCHRPLHIVPAATADL